MMLAKCLVLVIAALVLPMHCEDVKLPVGSQDVISTSSTTNERHLHTEKDVGTGDNRQGRMALHAEAPSSKAKREQALKNILAARRRQLLGSRISEVQKTLSSLPRTSRPVLGVSKDPLDMLEAQETRHGVYVTAPIGDEVSVISENDEEDSSDFLNKENLSKTSQSSSSPERISRPLENINESMKNSLLIRINETIPWTLPEVKINETTGSKNTSQLVARSQKILEHENRRKNTVAMPESLYNHFRPVESNIPVEDMTQFLYFGQKLHPDNQNASIKSTNSSSVLDVTSTSSSVASSRRRYSKRFSTTTQIPVPRLEDIINEEMNIALERSTIERNKIPKIKNLFRSPGSGTYFRKSPVRISDPTIVSNVILTRETGRNSSVISDNKRESVLLRNSGKFVGDPSVHANHDQVVIVADRHRGSNARVESVVVAASAAAAAAAHPAGNVTSENAADSTQLRALVARKDERRPQYIDNLGSAMSNDESTNVTNDKTNRDQHVVSKTLDQSISQSLISPHDVNMEMSSTTRHETIERITTWQSVHSNHESTTYAAKIVSDNEAKMTSSTINDLTDASKISSIVPTATTTSLAHSSLRIVVTEPMDYATGIEIAATREKYEQEPAKEQYENVDKRKIDEKKYRGELTNPVNQPDIRKNRPRTRLGDSHQSFERIEISGFSASPSNILINNSRINQPEIPLHSSNAPISSPSIESTRSATVSSIQRHKTQTGLPSIVAASAKTVKTEQKHQPHAYAYEITNVTRLLRNYTGPGLNVVVEQQQQHQQVKEDKRRKENVRVNERVAEQGKEEKEKEEEEESKNTSKKKRRKLEEVQAEEREKEGEEERGKEMERGPALTRTSSIQEIRNGGGSVQPTPQPHQPLPLLLPTLQRASASSSNESNSSSGSRISSSSSSSSGSSGSGGIVVEPARTPGELSAGTNAGEATASISADSASDRVRNTGDGNPTAAVGGRGGGKIIDARNILPSAFTTFSTDAVSQATTAGVAINNNTATSSLPKEDRKIIRLEVTEITPPLASTLRWNHTGNNRVIGSVDRAEINGNDRRYLRKSASAVLSQRTLQEGLLKEVKRRRGSNLSGGTVSSAAFTSSLNNRRRTWRNGANEERTSGSRSMENRTVVLGSADIEPSTSKFVLAEDALGGRTEKFEAMTEIVEEVTVRQLDNINQTIAPRSIVMEGTTIATTSTLESPVTVSVEKKSRDTTESDASSVKVKEVEMKSLDRSNFSAQAVMTAANASDVTNEGPNEQAVTLLTSTTSTSSHASSVNSVEITTTSAPPIFPVTPRMLPETGKTDEVNEFKPGPPSENKTEPSRPFGLAKDLDPSEIQKMYRSQTTLKPESVMTTIIPDLERSTDEYPASSTTAKEPARTMSPVNSSITRKPPGGERSPEVRGRNLSDKSKDNKDDILPIMQLYNTSDIFNGTGKDSSDSVNTVKSLDLPGVIKVDETMHNDPDLTATTTMRHESEIGENSTTEKKLYNSSDETPGSGSPRKNNNRHSSSREETKDYAGSTKSSNQTNNGNFYNSSQSNRTRHRPSYYQTSSPEFIGYRPEFNASFFEPGMISVSPRESINISEVITKRHDGDTIATQETVAVVSYILATLVVFPIAVGVGLILRRLIIRNRKVLEESDTSSEISCRKDALNLENGDFKTSIEKAITKLPRIQHLCHEAEKPPPPPSQESRWEFPRDKLRLQTVLGQGNFGQVWKAEADDLTGHQGTTRLVAVKTVKEGASAREKEDLVRELEIMQQLGNHPNVVTLLGCCTEEEPHYLILEYVMYGKLLAYLRDHRTRQDFYNFSEDSAALTSRDLTVFGYCVARGMEYLASKKIIHRDLAARNVLVDHNKLCKIADFGMSRFANDDGEVIEARHGRNALPIRWMAPESLIYSLFTTKTDVWSFGILMWEIVTLGSTPYPDMAAREVMRNVQNGYRLERPSHCRSELFRVISRCWHADPDRRPEFQTLRRDMAQLLEDSMNGHYVDLESFASECTD